MPFDPIPYEAPVEDLSYAKGVEGLRRLASLLEKEELWRNTVMTWDFGDLHYPTPLSSCGSAGCAIGLAYVMWPEFRRKTSHDSLWYAALETFHITNDQGVDIFGGGLANRLDKEVEDVTTGEVATAIREFISSRAAINEGLAQSFARTARASYG